MIFVDRTRVEVPTILTDPNGAGKLECKNAIANFAKPKPHGEFNFRVYKDTSVKNALIELFESKCAYCESTFLATYFGDVEHFRPKDKITEALPDQKPGYYWLASDWDNLFLSCKLCNSHKKHDVFGEKKKITLGKMNQFPLDNCIHIRSHLGDIRTEESSRLLIDPCKDNPEDHLEYQMNGNIRGKIGKFKERNKKGECSIKVFGLRRMVLVDERKKK